MTWLPDLGMRRPTQLTLPASCSAKGCSLFPQRNGTGRRNLNLNAEQLRKAVLPFPPPTEQNEVADMSRACDAKIAALERESALLDELFRVLLEELMTGRVAVARIEEDNG